MDGHDYPDFTECFCYTPEERQGRSCPHWTDIAGPDFTVSHHGSSLYILTPRTDTAHAWVREYLDPDRQFLGGGIVVEHRYIKDIVVGARNDGLKVVAS